MIESNIILNANFSKSRVFDCGSVEGLIGANVALASKDPKIKKTIMEILN